MCADGTRSTRPIAAPSTVVIVSPWTSTSGAPGAARSARRSEPPPRRTSRPRANQPGHPGRAQVAAAGAAAEPEIAAAAARSRRGRRDLLHLLAGRGQERCPRSSQPGQHRRELDQLAGRPVDDEDHERRPDRQHGARHIPAPWAPAYTGASAPNETTSTGPPAAAPPRPAAAGDAERRGTSAGRFSAACERGAEREKGDHGREEA